MDYHKHLSIPMSSPDLTDAERQAVMNVLNTPSLSMGPQVEAFEAAFRSFTGARFAISVNSGTAGLHLCVRAAGIQPGSLVITTPFSFVASTNAILFEQGIPVFVDVDPLTGNINPDVVEQAAGDLLAGGIEASHWLPRKGTENHSTLSALLPVDVFGQPADYDKLRQTAVHYGLKIIEDSCEALGAQYKGSPAGMQGDYGVFAFYPNKQMTTGEGGVIVTNDEQAANLMFALRSQGRAPGDTWLQHTYLGYNYRLDEMSAALGVVQMGRIQELMHKRQQVADLYAQHLASIPQVEVPHLVPATTRVSWFVYVIRLQLGIDRTALAQRLQARGVPVRPYFLPIHLQPYMVERFGYRKGDFPISEDLGERGIALPFSSVMSPGQVEYVCQALQDCLKG